MLVLIPGCIVYFPTISFSSFSSISFFIFLIKSHVLAAAPDKAPRKLTLHAFLLYLYNKYHSSHRLSTYTFFRCYHNSYYKIFIIHIFYTYCTGYFKFSLTPTYDAFCLKIFISPCSFLYTYLFFFLCFFTCPRCSSRHVSKFLLISIPLHIKYFYYCSLLYFLYLPLFYMHSIISIIITFP